MGWGLMLLPASACALEIPFVELLTGRPIRSIIDDAPHYPHSYLSLELRGWDIYHERRESTLHDYQQDAQLITAVWRGKQTLMGFTAGREALGVRQENVYTDADRLDGGRDQQGAMLLGGYRFVGNLPLGLTGAEVVAGAGSNGAFLGEVEVALAWGRRLTLLTKAERFSSEIVTSQQINGSSFPFHLPMTTSRAFGRLQLLPAARWRVRIEGLYGENSGAGDVVAGFENRLYFERWAGAFTFDRGVSPRYRLYLLPALEGGGGPGLRVRATYQEGDGRLGMRFDDVRYLYLDGLGWTDTGVRAEVVPLGWLTILGGWQRLRIQHAGGSFADVWPFVIWDVFQAKRYRLARLDTRLDVWYAGVGGRFESHRFLVELVGRVEWWDDVSRLDWLERVDILFPFFFRYEAHSENPEVGATNALQVDAALWFRFAGDTALRLSARATAPFRVGEGSGSTGPPGAGEPPASPGATPEPSTHGGLSGSLELIVSL